MKWININKEMPNTYNFVLIFSEHGNIDIGAYGEDGWQYSNGQPISKVTHWMPLPEKPVQKKDLLVSKHEAVIIEVVDSFKKLCDFVEQKEGLGCGKCPIYNCCFHDEKHKGIKALMEDISHG